MLTFEQFQATRTWFDNLGAGLSDASLEDVPGFRYVDYLYIDAPAGGAGPNLYHLHIANVETTSEDLESLERTLYDWACSEGYCDEEMQPTPAWERD